MAEQDEKKRLEVLKKEFDNDTAIVAEQASHFVTTMQPAYMVSEAIVSDLSYNNSAELLDAVSFYRIKSCSAENPDEIEHYLNTKMVKFYTAIHALNKPVVYGVVSYDGTMNLVIGVYSEDNNDAETVKSIMQGLLDGIELLPFCPNFTKREAANVNAGFISGIPSVKIEDERQFFDIGPIMKSLNGQSFSLLMVSRPVSEDMVSQKYGEMIQIRDACFAVSKRNLSRQHGMSHSVGETEGTSESHSHSTSKTKTKGGSFGLSFILSLNKNWSRSKTESDSDSFSKNYSKTVTDAVNDTKGESHDVQNGFALEMMEYADKAIERLRLGKSNGMWETVITYSAETAAAKQILESCLNGEMAKPNPDLLPAVVRTVTNVVSKENPVVIPKILKKETEPSWLCTCVTSEELGFISTPPVGAVPNFEVRVEKNYPLIADYKSGVVVGNLNDGIRGLTNMPFVLSDSDLARHTFVCGITGSGKTTTVKRIIDQAQKPFLVIESAKTEYRNIKLGDGNRPIVYTLGRPELNCISLNPFYIQNGISPQMHIDLLKDLFNASFSFYGPMPYILEKCLQNIYKNKGWNLTLGYHPYLANNSNMQDFFDAGYTDKKYEVKSHKYLFPTMQDLKDEVERYVEQEMNYEGEVAGNIKTAIKARLESLCSGSKGYMFNTHEYLDMKELLNSKAVFELEGLADDSDKAFAVGLLIIFVNEYRQKCGKRKPDESPLAHLLVIEEAHRLLKNTATENTSEDMGNPKGKAVEHFTNMIAEMRSYGQGVIVAEQIPSKLAPDVIKNSSNKIVQRLVAVDDQNIMANTIGIDEDDAMQLGALSTGKSLCHKEGMSKPVKVDIIPTSDITVTDDMLYTGEAEDRVKRINISILREAVGNSKAELTVKVLNSLLIQNSEAVSKSIEKYREELRKTYLKNGVVFIGGGHEREIQSIVIAESILQFFMRGTYKVKEIVSDDMEKELYDTISNPTQEHVKKLRNYLREAYGDDPQYKGKFIVSMLIADQYTENIDLSKTIDNYFICPHKDLTDEIKKLITEG